MDLVFLDIDGVLNCDTTEERVSPLVIGIDDRLVKNLAEFVRRLENPKIVLTSTWKHDWFEDERLCGNDALYMNEALAKHRLKIWKSINGVSFDRGKFIREFLDSHRDDTDSWVVLDDTLFDDFDKEIIEHLCQTDYHIGFDIDSIERALKIIQSGKDKGKESSSGM